MSIRKRWKKSLNNEIKGYDSFLKGAKAIVGRAPDIERRKREAEAKLKFVMHMPESIITEFGDKLYGLQKHDEEQSKLYIPKLPSITTEVKRYLSTGTSSSSEYLEIVQTYRISEAIDSSKTGVPHLQGPAEPINIVYQAFSDLADERAKKKTLPPRLNRINKNLAKKFRVAQQSYDKSINGILGIDQSAIQLRSVLEQLWGGLVMLVRKKDPQKYKGVELNLNTKGKRIVVECLAPDETNGKKLTDLLEIVAKIHNQISDSNFGKNPLTNDLEKLRELYDLWRTVISDIADFVYLNVRIKG